MEIRRCRDDERDAILEIVNDAAEAYRGVIPADRWHEPYMSGEELDAERAAGVVFWGVERDGMLVGVMGIQRVADVELIRHAYVRTAQQGEGIGGALLSHLQSRATRRLLVGTWADADWAIALLRAARVRPHLARADAGAAAQRTGRSPIARSRRRSCWSRSEREPCAGGHAPDGLRAADRGDRGDDQLAGVPRDLAAPARRGVVGSPAGARTRILPGRNVMLYQDAVPNVEVGVEVAGSFAPRGRIVAWTLPAGRVATATHRGSWDVGPAHRAVVDEWDRLGLERLGPRWEIYGHFNAPGDEEVDISYLVR